jgi:hypothetical protein
MPFLRIWRFLTVLNTPHLPASPLFTIRIYSSQPEDAIALAEMGDLDLLSRHNRTLNYGSPDKKSRVRKIPYKQGIQAEPQILF